MFAASLGKYKTIVVSIALFLLLDASVLVLNFYISFEIADDAVGVNLAGRQRMLSQRMVKSLYDMELSGEAGKQAAKQELTTTVELFDDTLNAFDTGGATKDATGDLVELQPVTSEQGRVAIAEAKGIWQPYKQKLNMLLSSETTELTPTSKTELIAFAKANNLDLLRLMNDLTVNLELVATSKATRLRLIQTVGITLAVINFLIILFHFVRQLNSSDRALGKARDETEEILATVNEGLFLINRDLSIASQYSKALETLFARKDIAGQSLDGLLYDVIKSKDLENTKRFISLLFKEDIKSKLISDLNPLKEIEAIIAETDGTLTSKFFSFDFQRAYEDDGIKDILVTVTDITQRVLLERELEATREQSQQQLEVLTSILHTQPDILSDFVDASFSRFEGINALLRQPAKSDAALRTKLEEIFFEIHKLKGEASALTLDNYVELTHDFEMELSDLRKKPQLNGDDFLPLVVRLEKLIKHSETVKTLSEKLTQFAHSNAHSATITPTTSKPYNHWQHLHELTAASAQRLDKSAHLVTSGLNELASDSAFSATVNDILIQGIRNAVAHGIESINDRLQENKPAQGRIDVRLAKLDGSFIELVIEDDGEGLNPDKIRQQAIRTNHWTESELASWSDKKIVSLIFEPGFSTEEDHNLEAGSGVGMSIIKQRLAECGGKIRISSRKGKGTRFIFLLPQPADSQIAA